MILRRRRQSGFTIIELLIATLVFSIVMLVVTTAVIAFSRQYYRGTISSATQSTARSVIDDISRSIEFNGSSVTPISSASAQGYCIGNSKRYSYVLGKQVVDQVPHGLVSDSLSGGCGSSTAPIDVTTVSGLTTAGYNNARDLLGQHMRLSRFDITLNGNIYTITVRVVYGDDALLSNPAATNAACLNQIGSEYCSVSELTTSVRKRID